jgi:uncharacterized membrane protein
MASPAHAALQLCNQTSYILYTAVGAQKAAKIFTRGWLKIAPGDCANAIGEPLDASAYFVYARSAHPLGTPPRVWGGQFQLCAKDSDFSLETPASASNCAGDGVAPLPYAPIATNGSQSWTMTFTESADIASADQARAAGLRRLLGEIGYAPGKDPKALDTALAQYRTHAKLSANTAPDALFAALENESKAASADQGYSICNSGNSEIWAAVGVKTGQDFSSRGWWNIGAGSCALAIGTPLGRDAVYLFASKPGNNHLVSGPQNFCISNSQFEIRGRDRCSERGLATAGFVATNPKGLPGYTARIGNNGLAP